MMGIIRLRRRKEERGPARYLRVRDVADMLGVHPATVWRWVKEGKLPRPKKASPRISVWREDEVLEAYERMIS